jgi:hypothetical protein
MVAGRDLIDSGAQRRIGPVGKNFRLDANFARPNLPFTPCPSENLRSIFIAGDPADGLSETIAPFGDPVSELSFLRIRVMRTFGNSLFSKVFGSSGSPDATFEVIRGYDPGRIEQIHLGIDRGQCLAGVKLGETGIVAGRFYGSQHVFKPAFARLTHPTVIERAVAWLQRLWTITSPPPVPAWGAQWRILIA